MKNAWQYSVQILKNTKHRKMRKTKESVRQQRHQDAAKAKAKEECGGNQHLVTMSIVIDMYNFVMSLQENNGQMR
jgi:hypothetical protein